MVVTINGGDQRFSVAMVKNPIMVDDGWDEQHWQNKGFPIAADGLAMY